MTSSTGAQPKTARPASALRTVAQPLQAATNTLGTRKRAKDMAALFDKRPMKAAPTAPITAGTVRRGPHPSELRAAPPIPTAHVQPVAAAAAATAPRPPTRLEREKKRHYNDPPHVGPWKLGKLIGQGASGRVRLAVHSRTQQLAAVKIIPKQMLINSRMSLRDLSAKQDKLTLGIEREIVIMKLIVHPNLLGLWDVYETSKELFLVMEYVAGGELFDYLVARGRLEPHEARQYFRQIIFGVDYCHTFSICHRDLKPENLLLDGSRTVVKIADFGMAALQPTEKMLETSCGSPHYASPEIVSGKSYDGTASDIWSCGVILFALLCGRLPFDDPNIQVLLSKVRSGKVVMPSHLDPSVRDLISRMIQVDPRKRATMQEICTHPWFTDNGRLPSRNPVTTEVGTLSKEPIRLAEIDPDILGNLSTLWPELSHEQIIRRLLQSGQNWQKTFYRLLVIHRDTHASDDEDDDAEELDEDDRMQLKQAGAQPSSPRAPAAPPILPAQMGPSHEQHVQHRESLNERVPAPVIAPVGPPDAARITSTPPRTIPTGAPASAERSGDSAAESMLVDDDRASAKDTKPHDNAASVWLMEQVRAERVRAEQLKKEQEQAEQRRIERLKVEKERAEKERLEKERAEKERVERERAERAEKERIEKERAERERAERAEKERLEKERAERAERARAEQLRAAQARAEQVRAEQAKAEQLRAERERAEQARMEAERRRPDVRAEQPRAEKRTPSRDDGSGKRLSALFTTMSFAGRKPSFASIRHASNPSLRASSHSRPASVQGVSPSPVPSPVPPPVSERTANASALAFGKPRTHEASVPELAEPPRADIARTSATIRPAQDKPTPPRRMPPMPQAAPMPAASAAAVAEAVPTPSPATTTAAWRQRVPAAAAEPAPRAASDSTTKGGEDSLMRMFMREIADELDSLDAMSGPGVMPASPAHGASVASPVSSTDDDSGESESRYTAPSAASDAAAESSFNSTNRYDDASEDSLLVASHEPAAGHRQPVRVQTPVYAAFARHAKAAPAPRPRPSEGRAHVSGLPQVRQPHGAREMPSPTLDDERPASPALAAAPAAPPVRSASPPVGARMSMGAPPVAPVLPPARGARLMDGQHENATPMPMPALRGSLPYAPHAGIGLGRPTSSGMPPMTAKHMSAVPPSAPMAAASTSPMPSIARKPVSPMPGFAPSPMLGRPTSPVPGPAPTARPTSLGPHSILGHPSSPMPGSAPAARPASPVPGPAPAARPSSPMPGPAPAARPSSPMPGPAPAARPSSPMPGHPTSPVPGPAGPSSPSPAARPTSPKPSYGSHASRPPSGLGSPARPKSPFGFGRRTSQGRTVSSSTYGSSVAPRRSLMDTLRGHHDEPQGLGLDIVGIENEMPARPSSPLGEAPAIGAKHSWFHTFLPKRQTHVFMSVGNLTLTMETSEALLARMGATPTALARAQMSQPLTQQGPKQYLLEQLRDLKRGETVACKPMRFRVEYTILPVHSGAKQPPSSAPAVQGMPGFDPRAAAHGRPMSPILGGGASSSAPGSASASAPAPSFATSVTFTHEKGSLTTFKMLMSALRAGWDMDKPEDDEQQHLTPSL